jgi:endonuclease/exonuclease/phosphatase family metal-dependent hydrolase
VAELVVAAFNLHGGVNGWGQPFDVVEACARLDADVLVLVETWTPEDGQGVAATVGHECGYAVHELHLARAMRFGPVPTESRRWGPVRGDPRFGLGFSVTPRARVRTSASRAGLETVRRGVWGMAVLSRLPVRHLDVIELGRLRRDRRRRRVAMAAALDAGGTSLTVVGTHLAHFTHGSPLLFGRLRAQLPSADLPAVLAGDMNFWGPPLSLLLPGWRRAVRARTYPSWRPHSQVDHILVTRPVAVVSGDAVAVGGSDHWPVRARIRVS